MKTEDRTVKCAWEGYTPSRKEWRVGKPSIWKEILAPALIMVPLIIAVLVMLL